MRTCQQCGGSGRVTCPGPNMLTTWCTACNGRGEIGGDEPWIETRGIFGGTRIYDPASSLRPMTDELNMQYIWQLERRVARLETMQRRKPKRKAGRR